MKRLVLGSLTALGAAILALAITPAPAKADTISIGFAEAGTNGGAITTEATSTVLGVASVGAITYGSFDINSVTAYGTGLTPGVPESEPTLDSNSINVSTSTAGTLYVYVTEQGLTTDVSSLLSTLTANSLQNDITSVVETTELSTTNALYAGSTPLDTYTFLSDGAQSATTAVSGLATYSETEVFAITASGVGTANDTIDLQAGAAVPEAGSLSMLAAGLLGIALLGLSRRRNTVMVAA
jgi:hypothetical protein